MKRSIIFTAIVSLFFALNHAIAQSELDIWAEGGIGKSSLGPALGLAVKGRLNKNLMGLRYTYSEEFEIFDPKTRLEEFAALYGRVTRRKNANTYWAAGPAYVYGEESASYYWEDPKDFHTVGLALEAGADWLATRYAGLGIMLFINVNGKEPVVGVMGKILLGDLR